MKCSCPPELVFSTAFLEHCGGCGSHGTTTCLERVVGGKQGHAPCKILSLRQSSFLCQLNVMDIIGLSQC